MTDRLPPSNPEAERALLGALLVAPQAADEVADHVRAADFYRNAHAVIWAAVMDLRDSGVRPDPVTVAANLDQSGQLLKVGGLPYLHTLMESVPTATNAGFYAEQVADTARRRRILALGQRATQLAFESGDVDELVDRVRTSVDELSEPGSDSGSSGIGDLAEAALVRYGQPVTTGLTTPWKDLNHCLNGGLRPGTLTIVGARPGQGKSIVGGQLCLHVAQGGGGALFMSLEMPEAEVTDRLISSLSRTNYSRILRHDLEDGDWERVQMAVDKLSGLPLRIVDRPYLNLSAIRTLARAAANSDTGLDLIVVDYIQLMAPTDSRAPREQQVAAMSRGLKLLAKELMVPVVALAQLNRGSANRSDKRPTLTDLRESGQLEADADHALLLHLPEEEERMGEIDMVIAKNRGGQMTTLTMAWAPHYQSIRCLAASYE